MFELGGGTLVTRQPIAATCGEKLCINPEHLIASTVAKVAQAAAKRGAWTGLARSAKISAKKRETAKITTAIAQEIRNSTGPAHVQAERHGIHKVLVQRIRRGEAWKDYGNPFRGLMA
jgi:DNA invertase Pin-like site-specific DNA recombinase